MAKILKNIFNAGVDEVKQNFIIESWHVSQSVDAFTGAQDYDITISGSLTITGSTNIEGVLVVTQGITGSLYGTASWALNSISSSYGLSASYASTSTSASYALSSSRAVSSSNALSSSYALSASYAANANVGTLQQVTTQGASTTIPITASIISASSFTGSLFGTASWAITASYALNSTTAGGSGDGDMLFVTSSTFNTQSKANFFFTGSAFSIGNLAGSDPTANGEISFNSSTKALVTEIKIPTTDGDGNSVSTYISPTNITKGTKLYFAHSARGLGWYVVDSYLGGSVGSPSYHQFKILYVSESGFTTWETTGDFDNFTFITPLNTTLPTGYNQITFSGSQILPLGEYDFGAYLQVRLFPSSSNKPGDITILEYNNSSNSNVKLDLQYASRSGSESQSNFSYTSTASPVGIYIPSASYTPSLLISSSEKGTLSLMTIKYVSGSTSQLGFMKLGFENVKLT
jgi:hypothetical protein